MKARIILADPPWAYNDRKATRRDNPESKAKFGIGAAGRYVESMGADRLCAMGPMIKGLSAPDAYLFMWVTLPFLLQRPSIPSDVLDAWGFRYVGIPFQWTKITGSGDCWKGPGRYVPSNMELVVLGVRGKPWHSAEGSKPCQEVLDVFPDLCSIRESHPRAGGKIIHSRKPTAVHERIEEWLFPQIGEHFALELFATRNRPGWLCLGHSVTGADIFDDLADLAS